MKRVLIFCRAATSLVAILISFYSFSQSDNRSLTKGGGYLNFNHPSGFSGFFFSLENERAFKTNSFLTHGPRLDYNRAKRSYSFPGIENLVLGYELKFYPFHYIKHKPYQGIFIGVYPCYFTPINQVYKYGPGLGSLMGYQYVFKDKISLSFEASVIYMQNVNEITRYRTNSQDRYFYITPSLKIGFKLGAAKK